MIEGNVTDCGLAIYLLQSSIDIQPYIQKRKDLAKEKKIFEEPFNNERKIATVAFRLPSKEKD